MGKHQGQTEGWPITASVPRGGEAGSGVRALKTRTVEGSGFEGFLGRTKGCGIYPALAGGHQKTGFPLKC